jgi:hypothetical protein
VIAYQLKTNTAAPVQAQLLPQHQGNRHLPFAGHGATAGFSHGESLPWVRYYLVRLGAVGFLGWPYPGRVSRRTP